jgi:hypothetical protein
LAPWPIWTNGKSLFNGFRSPDRAASSESLDRLNKIIQTRTCSEGEKRTECNRIETGRKKEKGKTSLEIVVQLIKIGVGIGRR